MRRGILRPDAVGFFTRHRGCITVLGGAVVVVRLRPVRSFVRKHDLDGASVPDNRLALLDQAFYEGHRAAGQNEVMQVGWVYERAVDVDQLTLFHRNLGRGLLGRLIERSPLPVGRHRWVSDPDPAAIEVAACPRSRSEVSEWFDECTQLPLDPEAGPGWRISVLPLTNGGTALSLVLSHYVIDGIGGAVAVTEAIWNISRDLGYPGPNSRTRIEGVVRDAGAVLREAPTVSRALIAALREARRRRDDGERSAQVAVPVESGSADEPVIAPSAWVRLSMADWNGCADKLGGSHSTLAAAFTAILDARIGRRHGGAVGVPMLLTVNDRVAADDARAIAVSFVRVAIDSTGVTESLSAARAAIKTAMKESREAKDVAVDLVALTPFTPKRTWRQLAAYARNDPDQPAVCSNLGDTGPAAIRPDGTLCDAAFARGASQHLTRRWLERIGSQLHVYYGTAAEMDMVTIYVCAYHPHSVTTKEELRGLLGQALAKFDLEGVVE